MGIDIPRLKLEETLESAIAIARSKEALPDLWLSRIQRLSDLGVKTYIAALGGALLAKATDSRVDSLTQDRSAGSRGYSLRMSAELMAERNQGRFHMGAQGRNPINNRPFMGGPSRIDEFTKIANSSRQSFELFRDCLVDLNHSSQAEALYSLASWLRVRMGILESEKLTRQSARKLEAGLGANDLLAALERFVREDTEGGRRGQSFVAAVLDCVFEEVVLQSINNPRPGDVRVCRNGAVVCAVEVKQLPVTESVGLDLASISPSLGASLALLVVLADRHSPLDREVMRRQALEQHGVLLEVAESVRELVGAVAVFSATPVSQIVDRLPSRYLLRMREHEVSESGQIRWREVVEAREANLLDE